MTRIRRSRSPLSRGQGRGNPFSSTAKPLDPRFREDDAYPSFPRKREPIFVHGKPLDPRFRGDDAAVSDRCDATRLALGQLRHLTTIHLSRLVLSASCTSSMFFFAAHASAC